MMRKFIRSRYLTSLLVILDAVAYCVIWFRVWRWRALAYKRWLELPINPIENYVWALFVYVPLWLTCAWYHGLFDHREKITGLNQASKILKTFIAGMIGSLAVAYLFKQWDLGRFVLIGSSFLYVLWLYASRSLLRWWKQRQVRRGVAVTRVAIVGVGRTARRVMERIVHHPEGGYRLVGFIDPHHRRRLTAVDGIPVLGVASDIRRILKNSPVDEVFLAVPKMPQGDMMSIIVGCEDLGVHFKVVANIFEVITSQVKIDVIDEIPVVHLRSGHLPLLQSLLKRLIDIVVACVLLIIFGLPMLLVALWIRLDSRGPALFKHQRVGLGGRLFTMYKFRTMHLEAEPYAVAPVDAGDPRITRAGRFLRRFSFDEFPQLMNVLLGQMSMVGPRPEMPFIVDGYKEWQRRRLDVKPGVTGLWQIVGRKNLPLALNLEYDFYYIKNQSLFLDLVILLKTIPAVIFGKGAF